jgi:hypothetical protein
LVQLAGMMAGKVGQSIPQQGEAWSDVKAAYRFLSNPDIDPVAIGGPHRALTRRSCENHSVVLCVQDTTELDFTPHPKTCGLGKIGKGTTRGMLQHTSLAVSESGAVLGILDERWHNRVEADKAEARTQRQQRWTERDVWGDAVEAIGAGPPGCRLIHVCDREADVFGMLTNDDDAGGRTTQWKGHDHPPPARGSSGSPVCSGTVGTSTK